MATDNHRDADAGQQRVRSCSRFCGRWIDANPERFRNLVDIGVLASSESLVRLWPEQALTQATAAEAFMRELRVARNECLFAIAWRDLNNLADLEQTLAALTALAERSIAAALAFARREADDNTAEDGGGLAVIAMGKLGGGELNFSSDIDLLFGFSAGAADDRDGDRASAYFKRLAQRIVHLLSEQTEDGFAFRVDTRLRPFGDTGPLAASLDAMENYYQSHGREWERYAWIKGRPVAGDSATGQALVARLQPFVYRRYLDYGAFESVREMKALIAKRVARRGLENNIKIGRGGIREIEFIVQAFQLIRGGHEPALQGRRLLPVLQRLETAGHLPERVVRELREAYVFLRRLENRLQMWADRQTHDIPADERRRAALATAMDFADWPALAAALDAHRDTVDGHFQQIFSAPQAEESDDPMTRDLRAAWSDKNSGDDGPGLMRTAGFTAPQAAWQTLADLRDGALYRGLSERGRRRLTQLVPLLVQAVATADEPDTVLPRVLGVLERIIGRTAYVALLVENPAVLSRLVALCGASPWITRQIEAQPVLLDSLLDPRELYRPTGRAELYAQLETALAAIPETDLERRMDLLRRFRHEHMLRVAAADVSNRMPLMIVSDHLSDLAEVILRAALDEAWRELEQRYGVPRRADGEIAGFAIIGYGKLGGLELGYGSDLDLVFVHGGSEGGNTDGKRRLSHPAFFLRLAQRVIHLLSTQTGAGRTYEVDTRLRPSGRSGLLAVGLEAFERYQADKAWTWEHQALVRARPVAGDDALAAAFVQMRHDILAVERDPAQLRAQVGDMRERMRAELDRGDRDRRDLKQIPGGLIDIEFMAQYAVLRHGYECRELLLFTDTIRILETMESGGLLDYDTTGRLTECYRAYRRHVHAQALQHNRAMVDAQQFADERAFVAGVWEAWFGAAPAGDA